MGVKKYAVDGKTWWRVDEWLSQPDGRLVRYRKKKIPTREQAVALAAKVKAEAFEGKHFERIRAPSGTVADMWRLYESKSKRDNDSWMTDAGRAKHLLAHFGSKVAFTLSVSDIDEYRNMRLQQRTRRGAAPTPGTLDREVELLKRMLNYAVACGQMPTNPVATAKLLRKPNVRRTVLADPEFQRLFESSEEALRPILVVAYDTGMREREILNLRWDQIDLRDGVIWLAPQDTKGEEARTVILTARALEHLRALPRGIGATPVFPNPTTGKPWQDIRKMFRRALMGAQLEGVWFHDLRRSFVTRARKRGIPESVVMRMSGHRTRAVFDRYNVVNEEDLRGAANILNGDSGHVLDSARKGGP